MLVATSTPAWTPTIEATTDDERVPEADVPVAALAPRARSDGGEDRQQRSRLRVELAEPEPHERRHEQDAAADAEEAREEPAGEAQRETEDDRAGAHPAISQTPTAVRRTANA